MRRAGFVMILALVLLTGLSVTAWAAWGAALRSSFAVAWLVGATATPTRTPRPATAPIQGSSTVPTRAAVELSIAVFTPTPPLAPKVTAASAETPVLPGEASHFGEASHSAGALAMTPEPLPADLVAIALRYGIDPSRRFVVVDQKAQQMIVWDPAAGPMMGNRTIHRLPISTGDESRGYRTLPWYGLIGDYWGTFHSGDTYADEGWYLYEDNGATLIHGAPYKLVNGQKVYEDLDAIGSYPASHGCIRLRPEDARWFTQWQPQGVPLVVLPK